MLKISSRLQTVASLVPEGSRLADIGTDHAYIPIYLYLQNRIPSAIAMDIGNGPLERAKEHILLYGCGDNITTRLSDGLNALSPGEADCIVIAGMGGGLVIHILETGQKAAMAAEKLVLQPQSEIPKVRKYLAEHGYVADAEEMVHEDGKYYPMMRVSYQPGGTGSADETEFLYGKGLLCRKHPVLLSYLKKERKQYLEILEGLKVQPESDKITARIRQIEERLYYNEEALKYFGV